MAETSLETIQALLEGMRRESKLAWDGLRRETATRFDALEQRLDAIDDKQAIANHRTTKLEEQLVRMDERIGVLQKTDGEHDERLTQVEGAGHVHQRKTDPEPVKRVHSRSDDGKPITRRDVFVGVSCSGAAVAALLWILQIVGKL